MRSSHCQLQAVRRVECVGVKKWRFTKRYAQANALARTALSPTKKLTRLHAIGASIAVSPT
jgi:hypothetical protein